MAEKPRILVDSSLWIDFYRPDGPHDVRALVAEALTLDAVHTVALIVTEVVQGAPDEAALDALLDDFSALHQVSLGPRTGARAARIGYALRRAGRPVPPTDLLIAAAAIEAECELWHRDRHFEAVAEVTSLQARGFGREGVRGG